jgi:predicted dehydrogenase
MPLPAPIGIGLIGLGRHGIRYARHLLHDIPDARLMAVSRRDPAQGIGLPTDADIPCYGEYRELIHDARVQALVVVTPPRFTRDICLAAAEAGKPMLIEKPLAPTGQAAHEMVEAAARAQVPLMTAHTLRFDPATIALKAQLGSLGQKHYLTMTTHLEQQPHAPAFAGGGGDGNRGVLLEVGIHLLDMVRYLTDEDVVSVSARMDRPDAAAPEIHATVQLWTTSGMPCLIDVARVAYGRVSHAEWIAGGGQLRVDWGRHTVSRITAAEGTSDTTVSSEPTIVSTLRAFLNALRGGQAIPVTGRDGLKAVRIADACYRSAEQGGQIVDVTHDD